MMRIIKWKSLIITCFVCLLPILLGAALWNDLIDIRKSVILILGIIFLVIGNYLPKLDYIKNYDLDTEKARKINRFIGFGIPYAIVGIIYGIKVAKMPKL